jgi:hypothetical protein
MEEIAAEKQYELAFIGWPSQAKRRNRRAAAAHRGAARRLERGRSQRSRPLRARHAGARGAPGA